MKNVDDYGYIAYMHFLNDTRFYLLKSTVSDLMCIIAIEMILRGDY